MRAAPWSAKLKTGSNHETHQIHEMKIFTNALPVFLFQFRVIRVIRGSTAFAWLGLALLPFQLGLIGVIRG